jgi:hypothetical protein
MGKIEMIRNNFSPASIDEIRKIIQKAPSKSSELNPIPTYLLLTCLDSIVHVITEIVNTSFTEKCVSKSFKEAIVRPLILNVGRECCGLLHRKQLTDPT